MSDDFLDVDSASWAPLEASIAEAFRGRHLTRFFAVSELSLTHYQEAADMLRLDRGVAPDGTLLLRVIFPFMGSTSWHEWSGGLDEALAIADELGGQHGSDVACDQAHGPTGWEVELDDR